MKTIKIKCKILIDGLHPLEGYKIDEFVQKTGVYNENMIDTKNEDSMFYILGGLSNALYAVREKEGCFYEYFENEELIEIDTEDEIYANKEKLQNYVLEHFDKKVLNLELRLRLITNICLSLPIYRAKVFNAEGEFITFVGSSHLNSANVSICEYTDKLKQILSDRTRFHIVPTIFEKLESENERYKRALMFYNQSFYIYDTGLKFALLFSALESLFNLDGRSVKRTVAKYTSKILFLDEIGEKEMYEKIRSFYEIRSEYIHGNISTNISKEKEFELREIARKALLIYWSVYCSDESIKTSQQIINYLDLTKRENVDLVAQFFIKSLDMRNYTDFYNEVRDKLERGETCIL